MARGGQAERTNYARRLGRPSMTEHGFWLEHSLAFSHRHRLSELEMDTEAPCGPALGRRMADKLSAYFTCRGTKAPLALQLL